MEEYCRGVYNYKMAMWDVGLGLSGEFARDGRVMAEGRRNI